jgi:osmotically-inducible protein OsmY
MSILFLDNSGKVPTQAAADRAISIARATDGVRAVKSALKVKMDD